MTGSFKEMAHKPAISALRKYCYDYYIPKLCACPRQVENHDILYHTSAVQGARLGETLAAR